MNWDMMLYVVGVLFVVLFVFYTYYKDRLLNKKLRDFEILVEELNRELYTINQQHKSEIELMQKRQQDETKILISKELKIIAQTILESVNELKIRQENIRSSLEGKILKIDEKVKEYIKVPASTNVDQNRVKALFDAGYNKEEIAKELHTNVGEVGFILNILNLQKHI
jgi:hypothetical protein